MYKELTDNKTKLVDDNPETRDQSTFKFRTEIIDTYSKLNTIYIAAHKMYDSSNNLKIFFTTLFDNVNTKLKPTADLRYNTSFFDDTINNLENMESLTKYATNTKDKIIKELQRGKQLIDVTFQPVQLFIETTNQMIEKRKLNLTARLLREDWNAHKSTVDTEINTMVTAIEQSNHFYESLIAIQIEESDMYFAWVIAKIEQQANALHTCSSVLGKAVIELQEQMYLIDKFFIFRIPQPPLTKAKPGKHIRRHLSLQKTVNLGSELEKKLQEFRKTVNDMDNDINARWSTFDNENENIVSNISQLFTSRE
eukprot:3085170-Rhodomonas_salina.1